MKRTSTVIAAGILVGLATGFAVSCSEKEEPITPTTPVTTTTTTRTPVPPPPIGGAAGIPLPIGIGSAGSLPVDPKAAPRPDTDAPLIGSTQVITGQPGQSFLDVYIPAITGTDHE